MDVLALLTRLPVARVVCIAIVNHAAIVAVDRVTADVAALEAGLDFFVFIVRGRARRVEQQVDESLVIA